METPLSRRTWWSRSSQPATFKRKRHPVPGAAPGRQKGKTGMKTKEEDFVEHPVHWPRQRITCVFTDAAGLLDEGVRDRPRGRATRGKAIVNLLNLNPGKRSPLILSVKEFTEDRYIMMARARVS